LKHCERSTGDSEQAFADRLAEGFCVKLIAGGENSVARHTIAVHGERPGRSATSWNHHRQLAPCWNDGSSGLPPLELRAIELVNRLGYNHHIERLMVISNLDAAV